VGVGVFTTQLVSAVKNSGFIFDVFSKTFSSISRHVSKFEERCFVSMGPRSYLYLRYMIPFSENLHTSRYDPYMLNISACVKDTGLGVENSASGDRVVS
jgi:hypothetical protein